MIRIMALILFSCSLVIVSFSSHVCAEQKKEIELVDGTPKDRKFEKITPVYARCAAFLSLECAMKKAKKQAHKAGADAIIDVKIESSRSSAAGYSNGVAFGGSDEFPVVTGWAVKWKQPSPNP